MANLHTNFTCLALCLKDRKEVVKNLQNGIVLGIYQRHCMVKTGRINRHTCVPCDVVQHYKSFKLTLKMAKSFS